MSDETFETTVEVESPLYLIESFQTCWKCSNSQRVIALASRCVRDDGVDELDEDDSSEPFMLTDITKMPRQISEYLAASFPQFQERYSNSVKHAYYANTCQNCGANFGDHYLFMEPDGAFFPQTEEEARQMIIRVLPFEGIFEFVCSWCQGSGDLIFDHSKRHDGK